MANQRKEVKQNHIEDIDKEKIIENVVSKIRELPNDKLMGFVKEFPFYDTDDYSTIQFTLQAGTKNYVESTLNDLKESVPKYEEDIINLQTEYDKEKSAVDSKIKKVKKTYEYLKKNMESITNTLNIMKEEEEVNKKKETIDYKKDYLKNIKDNIEYHEKILKELKNDK